MRAFLLVSVFIFAAWSDTVSSADHGSFLEVASRQDCKNVISSLLKVAKGRDCTISGADAGELNGIAFKEQGELQREVQSVLQELVPDELDQLISNLQALSTFAHQARENRETNISNKLQSQTDQRGDGLDHIKEEHQNANALTTSPNMDALTGALDGLDHIKQEHQKANALTKNPNMDALAAAFDGLNHIKNEHEQANAVPTSPNLDALTEALQNMKPEPHNEKEAPKSQLAENEDNEEKSDTVVDKPDLDSLGSNKVKPEDTNCKDDDAAFAASFGLNKKHTCSKAAAMCKNNPEVRANCRATCRVCQENGQKNDVPSLGDMMPKLGEMMAKDLLGGFMTSTA